METSKSIRIYLDYLRQVILGRLKDHFSDNVKFEIDSVKLPENADDNSPLSEIIRNYRFSPAETIALLTTLAPHVDPVFFDELILKSLPVQGDFPQFGGVRGKNHRGFLPTAETVLFILAGNDIKKRFECLALFEKDHPLISSTILLVEDAPAGEPQHSGRLIMTPEFVELFISGKVSHPKFSMDFPAEYITTELDNEDLVLPATTHQQIAELENWVKHQDTLMNKWKMRRLLKPGFRALFHGPPGTGKTLTALIVGKNTGRDVFRIDLSMVVSKFIGETEKNLSQLFERANNKDWILFFDEADALFGKRTSVRDAHDKYANQEVAYLLQRIENHNGLVILASNFKSNIDEAFIRRFQSVIYFPTPTPVERLQLWNKTLPRVKGLKLPPEEEMKIIAKKYEITGAGVVNVVQFCCLESLGKNLKEITIEQIKSGIEREYQKEGKVF
jgi:DNA polymerase III delta prime subunit